jgi:hypothetical protein
MGCQERENGVSHHQLRRFYSFAYSVTSVRTVGSLRLRSVLDPRFETPRPKIQKHAGKDIITSVTAGHSNGCLR